MQMTLTFAIVGRPNVGKSTLFNRLTGRQQAIVHDRPGVTRDRRYGMAKLADLRFELIDTAGLEEARRGSLEDRMRDQTEQAIRHADLTLLVIDGRTGITPADSFFSGEIRKSGVPVLLVANKCEGRIGDEIRAEAWQLGMGEVIPVSAAHGEGLGDLYDALVETADRQGWRQRLSPDSGLTFDDEQAVTDADALILDDQDADGREVWQDKAVERPMRIAVIGRPNMGKSTLVNRFIGEERLLTGPEAGITRDAIEIPFQLAGRDCVLIDTAGMRRRARVQENLEKQMVDDSLRAIRFAHLCILAIDAREPLHKQDLAIARLVADEGRGLVIAANMWDAVESRQAALRQLADKLETSLAQLRGVPLVPISGLQGKGINKLVEAGFDIYGRWNTRISTSRLNRWLELMLEAHPPPLVGGRRLRIRYATQIKTRPPTFALFVSRPADLPTAYLRYLAAGMRKDFDLAGLPLRLVMRKGKNPYV